MNTPPVYQQASFLLSAAKLDQLPTDEGIEVAFVGRSNAGKSTVLNRITGQKRLARTSKTPGRTQLINVFQLDADRRLIDLPGYGYAKAPLTLKKQWQYTLTRYLQTRQCLRGLVLLMDIRHPLKGSDQTMLQWAIESQLSTHILLNKADKLKRMQITKTLKAVNEYIAPYSNLISVQCFSALKHSGEDELYAVLNEWFKSE
ncbi:MAG: ribosome biogenesis GTP-binding protein YihA/YsxC [Gammaproteobacteria bacterium]